MRENLPRLLLASLCFAAQFALGAQAFGAGLQIVSGHGQAISADSSTAAQEPLRVRLTDTTGTPIPNADITWRVGQGSGNLVGGLSTTTNSDGEAINNFFAASLPPNLRSRLNVITATAPDGQSVDFYVTTLPRTSYAPAGLDVVWDTTGPITVRSGEVASGAIRARISIANMGGSVENIGLRLVNPNSAEFGPYAECRGLVAMSNAQGVISCDVTGGRIAGETTVIASVGGMREQTFTIRVEAGAASSIKLTGGNNQSGSQGQTLPVPLQFQVTDSFGTPMANVPVTWEKSPLHLLSASRVTDINGNGSAIVQLPDQETGTISLTLRAGSAKATFEVAVYPPGGALVLVDGAKQTGKPGERFAGPLVFRLASASGQPIEAATVIFEVKSGSATLSAASVKTDASGQAAVDITAGMTPGPVTISASAIGLTATADLTVGPAGSQLATIDVVNAAGLLPGISPGSIASIRVRGVPSDVRGAVAASTVPGPLPYRLAGVEVLFNGLPAPVLSMTTAEDEATLTVQVPWEVQPGSASLSIQSASGESVTLEGVQILPLKPGIFTFTDDPAETRAVATRPDGSYVTSANPARRGEIIRVYATGLGQTAPATGTNRVGVTGQQVSAPIVVGVDNAGARLISAELLQGSVGVYVIALQIAAEVQPGVRTIGLGVVGPNGEIVYSNGAAIPIL